MACETGGDSGGYGVRRTACPNRKRPAARSLSGLRRAGRIIRDEFGGRREAMIMMMQTIQRAIRYLPEPALYYCPRSSACRLPRSTRWPRSTPPSAWCPRANTSCMSAPARLPPQGQAAAWSGTSLESWASNRGDHAGHEVHPGDRELPGACAVSPVVVFDDKYYPQATVGKLNEFIEKVNAE